MPVRGKKIWCQTEHPAPSVKRSRLLSDFLAAFEAKRRGKLSKADRLTIVDQALVLLDLNYVHLPLKKAMHAVDPIQRLRLLKSRLEEWADEDVADNQTELAFHEEMQRIFTSTRDFHTNYSLSLPFNQRTAYLPFMIEEFFENGDKKRQKFLVSRLAEGFHHDYFAPGVEVLYWNGMPIKRAIQINGENQAGGNPEARFANGLDLLTIRPLRSSMPPDEDWVVVTYRAEDGSILELRQEWLIFTRAPGGEGARSTLFGRRNLGIDIKKAAVNEARKTLFAPRIPGPTAGFEPIGRGLTRKILQTAMDDTFRAWLVRTRRGIEFGYIRIFTFETDNSDAFVREFARLVRHFPSNGLIIDVRNNGGGMIDAGERLLQLLTPNRIKPELFELINTPLNLKISRLDKELQKWTKSLGEAVETGAAYSLGFPITDEETCNRIGQIYFGPVALIIDALCYSTTDIFAAGFADNEIGTLIGVSGNTGAGGANVWTQEALRVTMGDNRDSPYTTLPKGVGMRVAYRRSIRVGKDAGGRPLEDLGVVPEGRNRHFLTRDDLLNGNRDLISKVVRILRSKKPHELSAEVKYRKGTLFITPKTRNISRLDVYVNGRPARESIDVKKRDKRFQVKASTRGRVLLKGFNGAGKLVAVLTERF